MLRYFFKKNQNFEASFVLLDVLLEQKECKYCEIIGKHHYIQSKQKLIFRIGKFRDHMPSCLVLSYNSIRKNPVTRQKGFRRNRNPNSFVIQFAKMSLLIVIFDLVLNFFTLFQIILCLYCEKKQSLYCIFIKSSP